MNITLLSIFLILFCLFLSKRKENFSNLLDKSHCSSIYGVNHPRCTRDNTVKHLGYFKINNNKFPIMSLDDNNYSDRYLLKDGKFFKLKKEYWDKSFYFKSSLEYSNNISYDLISKYTYRGKIHNKATNLTYFLFGKRVFASNYKYLIFNEIKGKLNHEFTIDLRKKLEDGDPLVVYGNNTTIGPFVFYKNA